MTSYSGWSTSGAASCYISHSSSQSAPRSSPQRPRNTSIILVINPKYSYLIANVLLLDIPYHKMCPHTQGCIHFSHNLTTNVLSLIKVLGHRQN